MFKKIQYLVLSAAVLFGLSAGVMATMPSVDSLWNNNGYYIGQLGTQIRSNVGAQTAPSISSCGTATVSGSDSAMKVTITASTPSSCAVTFGTAWATAPVCIMNDETTAAGSTSKISASTTVVTATIAASNYGTDVLDIICIGRT